MELRFIDLHGGLGDLEVGQRRLDLLLVVGVGDLAARQPLHEGLHRRAGHAQRGRAGDGDRELQERDLPRQVVGVLLGRVLVVHHHRQHRQDARAGHEQVLRDGGDTAGAAQARGVPVVDEGQFGDPYDGHAGDERAVAGVDHDGVGVPLGLWGAGVEVPAAVEDVAPVGGYGDAVGADRTAQPDVGVGEDLVLRLVGQQPGQPGADRHGADRPPGGAVAAAELGDHVEHGADVRHAAAVPHRDPHLQQTGVGEGVEDLVVQDPVLLLPRGVLLDQGDEFGCPLDQVSARGRLDDRHLCS